MSVDRQNAAGEPAPGTMLFGEVPAFEDAIRTSTVSFEMLADSYLERDPDSRLLKERYRKDLREKFQASFGSIQDEYYGDHVYAAAARTDRNRTFVVWPADLELAGTREIADLLQRTRRLAELSDRLCVGRRGLSKSISEAAKGLIVTLDQPRSSRSDRTGNAAVIKTSLDEAEQECAAYFRLCGTAGGVIAVAAAIAVFHYFSRQLDVSLLFLFGGLGGSVRALHLALQHRAERLAVPWLVYGSVCQVAVGAIVGGVLGLSVDQLPTKLPGAGYAVGFVGGYFPEWALTRLRKIAERATKPVLGSNSAVGRSRRKPRAPAIPASRVHDG